MAIDTASLYGPAPDLNALQTKSNDAQTTASNYQSAADLLPTALKDAINQKLNYNSDIIDAQSKAQANYFAEPAVARAQYQNIFNPFDRESLVAQATANAYAPYQSLTNILGQRQGNISDIVNAGVGAFQSQVGAEQNNAQLAQGNYTNAQNTLNNIVSATQYDYSQNHPTGGGAGTAGAQ